MSVSNNQIYKDSLHFHSAGKKGKIGLDMIKPLVNQRSLALAYSPGVAAPCLEIQRDKSLAYEYTSKGNFVAVISNGTAVLGLGNLGALASKPVMEGKSVLFKRFADIDSIDIEVNTEDPKEFINTVKNIGLSWGGINLEDIKAPECFIIEKELKELLDIPVFHDDQHGTAIVAAAGLINAAYITGRKFADMKVVVNGAGAAAIACIELLKSMGLKNAILCDTKGVIYKGRTEGMNEWKTAHAVDTDKKTLVEVVAGADVFLGLSVKGALSKEMVSAMAKKPIIFAMANPEPEITPEDVHSIRDDAIVATGRSDYNNQVNNVMCFPYIFRGALDTQATTINLEMKIAAANAIAALARQEVTEEVMAAYAGKAHKFGPDYIIPVPFDSRLIQEIPAAVAKAAMDSGVAKKPIEDFFEYKIGLAARLSPVSSITNNFFSRLRNNRKKVIFADDSIAMVKAALEWCKNGYGEAIIVGEENKVYQVISKEENKIQVINPAKVAAEQYIEFLYKRMQRKGMTEADCKKYITNDLTLFGASMLANGEADAMVAGLAHGYLSTLESVTKVIDRADNQPLFTLSILSKPDKVLFMADTAINELPTAETLADIAVQAAEEVRNLGYDPRVAFISFSTFGNPKRKESQKMREAVAILDKRKVNFEYDGELAANVAINQSLLKLYPFCRLSKPANILIMPALHSAHISSRLLQEFGGATLIGHILCGLSKRVQIVQMGSSATDILNSAAISAVLS